VIGHAPRSLKVVGACALAAIAAACSTVAPTQMKTDRLDFNKAVSDSWKEQALLNLVRMRYGDMPVTLEVASVISSRSLEGQVDMSAPAILSSASAPETLNLGARTTVGNRPTVTYMPLSGERFTRSMLTPVQPSAIFGLIQSGWSAEFLLRVTVHSINDISQPIGAAATVRTEDPEFAPLLAALQRVQASGLLGMQVTKGEAGNATLLVFRRRAETPEVAPDSAFIRRTLGLNSSTGNFQLVYGVQPRNDLEIAVLTRSMFEIMVDMASGVQPPAADVAAGRVRSITGGRPPLLTVHSGEEAPEDAYHAVRYRDSWFWIAGDDLASRRTFTFLMILLSLTESGGSGQAPLITLPTG
jgi:hypothetical protein